uniref:Interleukin 6 receptor n=1 Tax=Zosterops lateralis melanops TaxID=1220523 RepID=A0A8D2PHU7_ZOSLA
WGGNVPGSIACDGPCPPAPPCLAEPPETPQVSCYRRSHDKDVLCEWPQQEKPSPVLPLLLGAGVAEGIVPGPKSHLSPAVKPDPPVNVTVKAVEKAPQWLQVNWSYPSSWDPRFYWLRFQVRYRPEPAPTFMEVRPSLHVVQVRAKDEFGHGAWSEWSQEAVGTPWTGRREIWGPETGYSAWSLPVSYSFLTV